MSVDVTKKSFAVNEKTLQNIMFVVEIAFNIFNAL